MKFRSIALAAIAVASFGAQASPLTTYAPWEASDGNGTGLKGVLFNVNTAGGVTVALGAHAFKNGVSLPNNGTNTYYAQGGTYLGPPAEANRANWSFDFAWNLGTNCQGCTVALQVDTNAGAGVNLVDLFNSSLVQPSMSGESWNMEMNFGAGNFALLPGNILQGTYDFNPFGASSTAFALVVRSAAGGELVRSDITVNVPEPGSLALVGLALAGLAMLGRRKA